MFGPLFLTISYLFHSRYRHKLQTALIPKYYHISRTIMASGEIVKGDLDADGRVILYIIKGIAQM